MRLLKAKQVAERTSISIPHINRMAREGKFPQRIKISEGRSGWLEEDVDTWISECVRKHHSGGSLS
jgi:predicted DNA-binding transcriptional regulator AlpA